MYEPKVGDIVVLKHPRELESLKGSFLAQSFADFCREALRLQGSAFTVHQIIATGIIDYVHLMNRTTGDIIADLDGISIGADCLSLANSKYPTNHRIAYSK